MWHEFFIGFGRLLVYFVASAGAAIALRRLVPVPREVFRKTLHIILLGSILVWIYGFETWWISATAALAFIAIVFPILKFAERSPGYSELLTERKQGEIKQSLVVVFGMFTLLICTCWGLLGERYLVLAAVFAWGFGDAAAALVGGRFGQHFIQGRLIEGRKSIEGTLAMFVVSLASVMLILLSQGSVPWSMCIPIAAATAAVCSVVELYTKGGMDTLTCPIAAAATLIPLIRIFGV